MVEHYCRVRSRQSNYIAGYSAACANTTVFRLVVSGMLLAYLAGIEIFHCKSLVGNRSAAQSKAALNSFKLLQRKYLSWKKKAYRLALNTPLVRPSLVIL